MEQAILANGKREKCTEMVFLVGQMARSMKVNTKMTRDMARENFIIQQKFIGVYNIILLIYLVMF